MKSSPSACRLKWIVRQAGWACLFMLLAGFSNFAHAKRLALLVGVGQYPALPRTAQLAGPAHDVAALREVLAAQWDFNTDDIETLVDKQATKPAVLEALRKLQARSDKGDEIVVYFSGHGTSALNSRLSQLPVPHGSGAFVTHDFAFGGQDMEQGLIIGRSHLVPIFTELENGGRKVWFISDSCYSGNQARNVRFDMPAEMPGRFIPMATGRENIERQNADMALASKAPTAPPYPYRTVISLAAAGEAEVARDISGPYLKATPTLDGKPHGALTDALLRVLSGKIPGDLNGDGVLTLTEVHRATTDFMAQRAYGHTPQRRPSVSDDDAGLGQLPVLSKRGVAAAPLQRTIEPLRVLDDLLPPAARKAAEAVADVVWVKGSDDRDLVLTGLKGRMSVRAASGDLLVSMDETDTARLVSQLRQVAWAKRLRTLADNHKRSTLAMDIDPEIGGNFYLGSKIAFVVRPERSGSLVLLNISSDGKVSVLYPQSSSEARPLAAGQAAFIPGQTESRRITVQEPVGMDLQFALLFDEAPPLLPRLFGAMDMWPDDGRLIALETAIREARGKFAFASSSLRTIRP